MSEKYVAAAGRYSEEDKLYRRCGKSGLKLPKVSLGLRHNFGTEADMDVMKSMLFTAFDHGITHFDLANNYGPEPGAAEENFGKIMSADLRPYRDEMIISSKAGFTMWDGPYGDWGSRKYLMASLDQSLKRMQLDYVDIFYHHRMDPETPLEETIMALDQIVRSGKALYVGISNYDGPHAAEALYFQTEFPDGVYARVNVGVGSTDELVLALSEATPVLQEGLGAPDNASFAAWVATNDIVRSQIDERILRAAEQGLPFKGGDL